jgi:hypothetical protein
VGTMRTVKINRQTFKMPADLTNAVCATLDDWKKKEKVQRLWRGDTSLWTGTDEAKSGAGGQTTLIIPSHDLVVVRLGHYKGSEAGDKSFKKALAILMEAVPRRK